MDATSSRILALAAFFTVAFSAPISPTIVRLDIPLDASGYPVPATLTPAEKFLDKIMEKTTDAYLWACNDEMAQAWCGHAREDGQRAQHDSTNVALLIFGCSMMIAVVCTLFSK